MSYNHALLFETITKHLQMNPRCSINYLSNQLKISRRTIQEVVSAKSSKTFSALRQEVLLNEVKRLLVSKPELTIKEISFNVGFYSPRSFARSVKKACGYSPEELRLRLSLEHASSKTHAMTQ